MEKAGASGHWVRLFTMRNAFHLSLRQGHGKEPSVFYFIYGHRVPECAGLRISIDDMISDLSASICRVTSKRAPHKLPQALEKRRVRPVRQEHCYHNLAEETFRNTHQTTSSPEICLTPHRNPRIWVPRP